ncbi:hypothetical protein JKP88DRAFT_226218 [Tribonema minus]|uniref:Uncharacterized protein n=1 Tax=Tribonema minus TaxID=303371 RepID=A0A835YV95_9STRA|nr:hypothetical protein JKP88DRAFT_226218 [Tribonema minus]
MAVAAANAAGAAPTPAAAATPLAAAATAGGTAAAPAHAAAAAVNAGAARSTPVMLQGAAAAEVARLPLMRTIATAATSLRAATGDKLEHILPPALTPLQQQPPTQQPPLRPTAGGGTGADAACVLDASALQLQCSLKRPNQSALADAVATELADKLAVKRAIGVEEQTAGCKLCGKSPGGTLHARLCQAPRVKAHDTIVHNSVKRATQRILRQYLKTGLVDEDYTPFLGSAGPPGSRRMDIVLPADAFPVTGYDDPTRHLPLMVDVTCFEAQVASRAAKTAADPERCCRDQEAAKTTHYSGHYDQNCYKLATLAIGSFGSIGEQGRKLLEAVATEYASRMSVPGGARPKALKGIALARLRSALSAALHMAYSGRVMTHMAESRGGGAHGGGLEPSQGHTNNNCIMSCMHTRPDEVLVTNLEPSSAMRVYSSRWYGVSIVIPDNSLRATQTANITVTSGTDNEGHIVVSRDGGAVCNLVANAAL